MGNQKRERMWRCYGTWCHKKIADTQQVAPPKLLLLLYTRPSTKQWRLDLESRGSTTDYCAKYCEQLTKVRCDLRFEELQFGGWQNPPNFRLMQKKRYASGEKKVVLDKWPPHRMLPGCGQGGGVPQQRSWLRSDASKHIRAAPTESTEEQKLG